MSDNEQSRSGLLVQVGLWAFVLGTVVGFVVCWILFAGGSGNLPSVATTQQIIVRPIRTSIEPAAQPAPEIPGQMISFRNRVGQSMLFKVKGIASGATIWGTEIYTDDSPLPITAVHAGALAVGEEAIIRVTILAGQNRYTGSTSNGITSQNYEKWEGSYRLERETLPPTEPVLDLPTSRTQPLQMDITVPTTQQN